MYYVSCQSDVYTHTHNTHKITQVSLERDAVNIFTVRLFTHCVARDSMPTRTRIHIDVDLFRAICSYSCEILTCAKNC